MQTNDNRPQAQLLERGNIVFLYQPKNGVTHVQGANDLERLYLMLIPDKEGEHKSRIYSLSGGSLPGGSTPDQRAWAVAREVEPDPRVALDSLQKEATGYETRAQGTHAWLRAAGEGRYAIVRQGDGTYLADALNKPEQPGEVQQALQIGMQGNYRISVKAPAAPAEAQPAGRPPYPSRLEGRFVGPDVIAPDTSDFLDYRHTQVLLQPAAPFSEQEPGLALPPDVLNQGQRWTLHTLHREERKAAQEGIALMQPLETGRWA